MVDIELRALAGGTPFTPAFNVSPNNALGDGVDANDTPFFSTFPFLRRPHPGNEVGGPRVNSNPGSTNLESASEAAMSKRQRLMFVVAAIAIGAIAAAIYSDQPARVQRAPLDCRGRRSHDVSRAISRRR